MPRAHPGPFTQSLELPPAYHSWELAAAVPEVLPLQVGKPVARPLWQPACCAAGQQESLPEAAAESSQPVHATLWEQVLHQLSQRLSQGQLPQQVAGSHAAASPLSAPMPWLGQGQGMWHG